MKSIHLCNLSRSLCLPPLVSSATYSHSSTCGLPRMQHPPPVMSQQTTATVASRFLALPPEIRLKIYTFLLHGGLVKYGYVKVFYQTVSSNAAYTTHHNILLTCRICFQEARVLYYNLTMFHFTTSPAGTRFLFQPHDKYRHIRHLQMTLFAPLSKYNSIRGTRWSYWSSKTDTAGFQRTDCLRQSPAIAG